jgi:translation initiation factor 1A
MSTVKGGKKKRRGKNMNSAFTKPFVEPIEGQYFAKAIKPLGSLKVQLEVFYYEIKTEDKKIPKEQQRITFKKQEMIGNVRGNMRKREWVNPGDIVLVSERGFTKDAKVVDIVMKYPNIHHNIIKRHRFCPSDIMFFAGEGDDNINFFGEEEYDDEDGSDEDIGSKLSYTTTKNKTIKRKTGRNDNYMDGIDLPEFDNNLEEYTESAVKEVDKFGNFI